MPGVGLGLGQTAGGDREDRQHVLGETHRQRRGK
jgi:hypothetical protein